MPMRIRAGQRDAMDARWVRRVVWSTVLLPLAWLGLFWLYVLRARIELGGWPRPYQPDPKDLGFGLHYALIWLLLPSLYLGPGLAALWALSSRGWLRSARVRPWLFLGVGIGLAAAVFTLVRLDPGRFFEWYMD